MECIIVTFDLKIKNNYQLIMRNQSAKAQTLYLTVQTWQKDSHGLFDYEANKLQKQYFEIQGPCKLYRNWLSSNVCALSNESIKKGQIPDQAFSFHCSVSLRHNGNFQQFVLGSPERPSQQIQKKDNTEQSGPLNTNTYMIVKFLKPHRKITGYAMKSDDIIKLGRVQFKVVQIGGTKKKGKKEQSFLKQFQGAYRVDKPVEGTCKFCLCDQVTEQNVLISPCKCKGSCQVVHIDCLKTWINSKVKKQINGVVASYNFAKFQCQLCKQPFPTKVINGQHQIQMLLIEKPSKPYLILENINERRQSKEQRCLHIISMEDGGTIKMGRGHLCQIRLQDISVSRTHSEIKYQDGEFYLIDQNSKFGTLVRLTHQVQLTHQLKLQVGRSLYQFTVQ